MILERILGRDLKRSEVVDHIDGNGLNCVRNNLRLGNQSKNRANSRKSKHNTTGYKGVFLQLLTGRYISRIRINYRLRYLGTFDSLEEAHEAYKTAAIAEWGEFAKV